MTAFLNTLENIRIDLTNKKSWEVTDKFYKIAPTLLMVGAWIGFMAGSI